MFFCQHYIISIFKYSKVLPTLTYYTPALHLYSYSLLYIHQYVTKYEE